MATSTKGNDHGGGRTCRTVVAGSASISSSACPVFLNPPSQPLLLISLFSPLFPHPIELSISALALFDYPTTPCFKMELTVMNRLLTLRRAAISSNARLNVLCVGAWSWLSFSAPQIKRTLRVVSVDREVFEALMLSKRLRPDVSGGRSRQFNYIGKLLREVQPELTDKLIEATKEGNHSELQKLCGSDSEVLEGDDDFTESESEGDGEEVEFDRQELRKLVRRVHSAQEQQAAEEAEKKSRSSKNSG